MDDDHRANIVMDLTLTTSPTILGKQTFKQSTNMRLYITSNRIKNINKMNLDDRINSEIPKNTLTIQGTNIIPKTKLKVNLERK